MPWRRGIFAPAHSPLTSCPALAVLATMALVSLHRAAARRVVVGVHFSGGVAILLTAGQPVAAAGRSPAGAWGARCFGIAVVRRNGAPVGPWGLLLRDLAHLLDTVSVVGWLWPLWDSRRRTFADMLLRTEVRASSTDEPAGQACGGGLRWRC